MRHFTFFLIILCLSSCSKDKRLDNYYRIVDSADKLRYYIKNGNSYALTWETMSLEQLQSQKNILKRNIKLDLQRKFTADHKIEIYMEGKLLGTLLINTSKEYPFVNFQNKDFGFGFRLTYGIGMSL